MLFRLLTAGALFIGCWLNGAAVGRAANDAEQAFQRGQQLVAEGDLRAAVQTLGSAVKLDRDNQRYLQQYLLTRQAVQLQAIMDKEKDSQRWEMAALALSSFYSSQNLYARALPVDEAMFKRLKTADSAVQLAETLLSLEKPDRAAEVLASLGTEKATTASRALRCVALARQGEVDEAKRVAATLRLASDADPGTLYLTARAQATVGQEAQSLATLTRCFEGIPPSRLDLLKSHTKLCVDFQSLATHPSFTQVLQTESKVSESKCSGGSSCSSCPMRGSCGHGNGE